MRVIGLILVLSLVFTPCLAETVEVSTLVTPEAKSPNFWQEFDITFWQTMPFAALWGYVIDRQLSSLIYPVSAAHWQAILPFAVIVSAGNALIHTQKVIKEKSD